MQGYGLGGAQPALSQTLGVAAQIGAHDTHTHTHPQTHRHRHARPQDTHRHTHSHTSIERECKMRLNSREGPCGSAPMRNAIRRGPETDLYWARILFQLIDLHAKAPAQLCPLCSTTVYRPPCRVVFARVPAQLAAAVKEPSLWSLPVMFGPERYTVRIAAISTRALSVCSSVARTNRRPFCLRAHWTGPGRVHASDRHSARRPADGWVFTAVVW
jgi:hypothetical protein